MRNIVCGDRACKCEVSDLDEVSVVASGSYETLGWDIPTYWAVLEGGIALMSDGHGVWLNRTEPGMLLADASDNPDVVLQIRSALGRKPSLPTWVRLARQNGWVPPAGWDESKYDAS